MFHEWGCWNNYHSILDVTHTNYRGPNNGCVGEAALKSFVMEVLCWSPPCIDPVDEYLGILRQTLPLWYIRWILLLWTRQGNRIHALNKVSTKYHMQSTKKQIYTYSVRANGLSIQNWIVGILLHQHEWINRISGTT
jgi:hypothetical protein